MYCECFTQIEKLKHLLRGHDSSGGSFVKFEPIPCPLDPTVAIRGIDVESATLFKSSLQPCKLAFHTLRGPDYVTIFKHGDDLRQDQLVLQIIQLMDRLLRNENLDLKLTPYKVLATGSAHGECVRSPQNPRSCTYKLLIFSLSSSGLVQFIPSMPISEILRTRGSVLEYLREEGPSDSAPMNVQSEVMDNYVKSCGLFPDWHVSWLYN